MSAVRPMSPATVAQATVLKTGPLTNAPMSRLSLMSRSMRMSTKGSTTPLTTWDTYMTARSGMPGTRMVSAPAATLKVNSQKNSGALRKSLSMPSSQPMASQM